MLSRSYWEDQLYFGKPDYIVVGGGLVGMYTAYYLKKNYPDADILVLERGPFGEGASTKNAGYACFGSVSELIDDIELFGTDKVKETLTMRWQGLQLTRSVLKDENINYEEKGGTEVFLPENSDLKNICLKKLPEINALVRECIGMPGVFEYHEGSPKGTKGFDGYIFNRLEGCLNTSMFNNALYQKCIDNKIRFLFGFDVDKLKHGADPHVIHKKYGAIYAKSIFVTTNGFVNHLIPDLDVKPVRNQVIVTEEIEGLQLNGCYHMDKGYFYFRNIGKRILIGGGRNKLGSKEETFFI
jgi:gamma-glutamylputrescine oxidase